MAVVAGIQAVVTLTPNELATVAALVPETEIVPDVLLMTPAALPSMLTP